MGGPSRPAAARCRSGGHSGGGACGAGSGGPRTAVRRAGRALRRTGSRATEAQRVSRERHLVAGLDVGSTKTCAVIAEVTGDLPRSPVAKILGVGLAKNAGVRRGVVRDIDETTRSIVAALRDAERMAGVKVGGVTCGIAGDHVQARVSSGVVAVDGGGVGDARVARAQQRAPAGSVGGEHAAVGPTP